jgi:4-amino-4-deoxy-L-arabinose transferase-like glycosyltransferase
MGLSALVKGPVGPVVVGLAVLGSWLFLRKRARLGWGYLPRLAVASIVCGAVFAAWFLPANAITHGEFVDVFIGEHILRRATEPMESHGVGRWMALPFYAGVILAGFSPWSLLLPAAGSALAGGRLATREARVVTLCWAVPTLAAFCAVATTLPHYILPLWPALAVLAGATVVGAGAMSQRDRLWLRRAARAEVVLLWLPAAGLLASPVILWIAGRVAPYPYFDRLQEGAFAMGLVLLAMAVAARRLDPWRHIRPRYAVLTAGMLALAIAAGAVLVPALEAYKAPRRVARRVNDLLPSDLPLYAVGFREPSLLFYLDRTPVRQVTEATLADWADREGPAGLIIPRDDLGEFGITDPNDVPASRLGHARGLNLNTGMWLDVVIYRRQGGDPNTVDAGRPGHDGPAARDESAGTDPAWPNTPASEAPSP